LAAPWIGLLESDAWIAGAKHANTMAKLLASHMPFPIRHPVDANGVFVEMGDHAYDALIGRGWRVYRFLDGSVRFMCSWASQAADIEALADDLRMIADRYVDNGWPVICDLICPTPYTRLIIDADITVWLDTVMTEQDLFIEPTEDEYTLKVIDDNTSGAAVIADLVNILE
jgi:hypothetical protein